MNKKEANDLGYIAAELICGENADTGTNDIANSIMAVSSKIVENAETYLPVIALIHTKRAVIKEVMRRRGYDYPALYPT